MNDAEADIQKARIQRYLDKWMPAGFGWWKLKIDYERGSSTGKESLIETANIIENWEYRSARITFYLDCTTDLNDDDLEHTVVHELSHLLLGSIRDYSTDDRRQMTEFAVTAVTRALLGTNRNIQCS